MLLKWHNQGDFICTGSKSGNDQDKTPQGINYGHAYTVLRVVEIQGYKLMQLRNPWGSGEWTGDWGDKSSKWTPRLRSLLNVTNEQDGIFWMSFDDYTNNFRSIYASIRLNDKYKYQLDGSFNCDEKDGASPFANGETDALNLPQWIIRCKSSAYQPTLHCIFEKSGGSAYCDVLLVYHNGSKLKYLQGGVKFNNFGMPHSTPLISFQWLYEEPSKPINLLIYRKKLNEPTTWHFEIYFEAELEITKLE